MRRKRGRQPDLSSPRRPHPDARIEAELQRILSLQKAILRKDELLAADHQQIADLRHTVTRHPTWDGDLSRRERIAELLAEADDLEAEVAKLHDDIAARISALSDTDLAYLNA